MKNGELIMRTKQEFKRISVTKQIHDKLLKDRTHYQNTMGGGRWSLSDVVEEYLKKSRTVPPVHHVHPHSTACSSAQVRTLEREHKEKPTLTHADKRETRLSTWPVQLKLLPPNVPFFENADLLIAADCVPFAYADFHEDLLKGKTLAIGCPKLDDAALYRDKLAEIFKRSDIRSVTVINMEVPCCFGLYHLVKEALASSGKNIPIRQETISIKGEKIS